MFFWGSISKSAKVSNDRKVALGSIWMDLCPVGRNCQEIKWSEWWGPVLVIDHPVCYSLWKCVGSSVGYWTHCYAQWWQMGGRVFIRNHDSPAIWLVASRITFVYIIPHSLTTIQPSRRRRRRRSIHDAVNHMPLCHSDENQTKLSSRADKESKPIKKISEEIPKWFRFKTKPVKAFQTVNS